MTPWADPATALRWVAHPEWIAPIASAFAATLACVFVARRTAIARRLRLGASLAALREARRARPSDAALLAALAAIGVAAIGPRIGWREVRVAASGVDVVLLVDVSRSMDAADVPPSRLDRARKGAREILRRLHPGDRAALAAFAGRGVLLTPLTPDFDALVEMLSALDTDLVHPRSSNLGDGIRTALEAFPASGLRPRVAVAIGDGEDPEARGGVGAEDAVRASVRVLGVAIGTEAGATIPDHGLPLVDRRGAVVVSRRQSARLERLATATGGEVFTTDEWGDFDADLAIASIRRDAPAPGSGEVAVRRVRGVRVAPLAAVAFALLLFEGLPLGRRSTRPRASGAGRRGAWLAATLVLGGTAIAGGDALPVEELEAELRGRSPDAHRLTELGVARLEAGDPEAAMRAFRAASLVARDRVLASIAYYDLGVAALEAGDPESARDAFFDALALAPRDRRARFNLEWTLEFLRRRVPPPPLAGAAPPEEPPPDETKPRPEPEERPRGRDERESEEPPTPRPDPLEEAERRRWLDRVQDDPARALRSAARAGDGRSRGPRDEW